MDQNSRPSALLLEDQLIIAMDAQLSLEKMGFNVVHFSRCLDAEDWLAGHWPSVAVIDLSLSDGVCVAAAKTLTEHNIPFIVHSGEHFGPDHHEVFAKGTWFNKPSVSTDLASKAKQLAELARI